MKLWAAGRLSQIAGLLLGATQYIGTKSVRSLSAPINIMPPWCQRYA